MLLRSAGAPAPIHAVESPDPNLQSVRLAYERAHQPQAFHHRADAQRQRPRTCCTGDSKMAQLRSNAVDRCDGARDSVQPARVAPAAPAALTRRRWSLAALLLALAFGTALDVGAQVPLADVVQVVGGGLHGCALTSAGGVKCWGANVVEPGSRSLIALDVDGLTSGVSAIAAHDSHTCALTSTGGVKCWGSNSDGRLGDGSTTNSWTPVDVVGLTSPVIAIAAGSTHSCALTDAGGVKCWGSNAQGQLGDGTTTTRLTARDVSGLPSGVSAIAAGDYHSCAISAGGVKCWGNNAGGQLGNGSSVGSLTAVAVVGLSGTTVAIKAGFVHTCALSDVGGVQCWGYNEYGQLGDDSTETRLTAVNVTGLDSGVSALSVGALHSCAVTGAGALMCWGYNENGELGNLGFVQRQVPTQVAGLGSGVATVGASSGHTCAITGTGSVLCWGSNAWGQLGDNQTYLRALPTDVAGLASGVAAISTGSQHSCAVTDAGAALCWGENEGRLGDGTATSRYTPTGVWDMGSGVAAIANGEEHSCALTSAGGLKCWGTNWSGAVGDGTSDPRETPTPVFGLESGVSAITTGGAHSCALTSAGGLKCWGYNAWGQLGDGSTSERSTAVDVSDLASGVAAVAAGSNHTCAVTVGGGARCWGYNVYGQLGDGTTTTHPTAVEVDGLDSGVAAIAAGALHSCALTTAGAAVCWGRNEAGQLGTGSDIDSHTAVGVTGLGTGVTAIAAGAFHSCALIDTGGVKCWGENGNGQLGDGTNIRRLTPVDVVGLTSGVAAIATFNEHTCALTMLGAVKCWGWNDSGQIGDGTVYIYRLFPAAVLTIGAPLAPTIGSASADDRAASVAFLAPANDGGSPITGYVATSFPGALTSSGCVASPCTVSGLDNGTAYTFSVAAVNLLGTGQASAASNSVTPRAAQSITFGAAPVGLVVDSSGTLSASGGGSPSPVVFSTQTPAICTVSDTTVTGTGAGSCSVAANQAGSAAFHAAPEVSQTFAVGQGSQTIVFGAAPSVVVAGTGDVAASGGGSSQPVLFASQTPATCSVSGSTVTGVGVGDCSIAANQAGDANYHPAAQVIQTFGVGKQLQSIVFGAAPASLRYGDIGALVSATASSDLTISYGSTTPAVCSIAAGSGVITILAAGSCTASADQPGNAHYAAAAQATQTFAIGKAVQAALSVSATPATLAFGGSSTLQVSGGSGSGAVSFALTAGATSCGLAGSTLSGIGVGPCTVTASKAGDDNHSGISATLDIAVSQASQTISFGDPPSVVVAGTGDVAAAGGGSSQPVLFASQTPATCSIVGSTVSGLSAGACMIAANQAGDTNHSAAEQVTQTFNVGQGSQSISFSDAPGPLRYGDSGAAVSAAASSDLTVGYGSTTPAVCSIDAGSGAITILAAGSCTATADQPGNADYAAAAQATQTFAIGKAVQLITFDAPADRGLGVAPFTVSASGGGSTNPVTFSTPTIAVCATGGTHGATVTLLAAGTCTLRAAQAGDANHAAAADVERSFAITGSAATVTLGSDRNPADVGAAVTFTATVSGQSPTGTVAFFASALPIAGCTAQPLAGSGAAPAASCTTDMLSAGSHAITAVYAGDDNHTGASSAALTQLVNAYPTIAAASTASVLEDASSAAIIISIADAETAAQDLQLVATSLTPALFSDAALAAGLGGSGGARTLILTPLPDAHGEGVITLTVTDGHGASSSRTLAASVLAVNDPPSASYGRGRTHAPGTSGPQTIAGFATAISPGPNEAEQSVSFETTVLSDPRSVLAGASIDAAGTLRYTLTGELGRAELAVAALDDGGTEHGGSDRGATQRLMIQVVAGIDLTVVIQRSHPAFGPLAKAKSPFVEWTVTLANNGPVDATDAGVRMLRQHGLLYVLWSCLAPAICTPADGAGVLDARFDLAVGASLTAEVSGVVDFSQSFVELMAQVVPPAGVSIVPGGADLDVHIEPAGMHGIHKDGFD
jgi:alpha-tubulin suppressor-like RCC1 family protein